MELYIQYGYGMMEHSRALTREWGVSTTILSPRDLEPKRLVNLSEDLIELGGRVLVDPQFYLPRSDHHRLIAHDYWPADYDTAGFGTKGREIMLKSLDQLNRKLGSEYLIIPGERADTVNDLWLDSQYDLHETAANYSQLPLIATICLSAEAIRSSEQIGYVMEFAEDIDVTGFYLVLEHPKISYLVNDPVWISNTLDLAAGLHRLDKSVIVGYSNQQQLLMACAGVDAIASGTWMNVRCFPPDKFRSGYETEIKTRAVWYYLPQALSEYTLPYLDIGIQLGLKDKLEPDPTTPYSENLFSAPQPSVSGWGESDAFRHYLMALHHQCETVNTDTFELTLSSIRDYINQAEDTLGTLHFNGITGRPRDFSDVLDASRAALIVLERIHGPVLKRHWL